MTTTTAVFAVRPQPSADSDGLRRYPTCCPRVGCGARYVLVTPHLHQLGEDGTVTRECAWHREAA